MRSRLSNLPPELLQVIASKAPLPNARALSGAFKTARAAIRPNLTDRQRSLHAVRVTRYAQTLRTLARIALSRHPQETTAMRTVAAPSFAGRATLFTNWLPDGMHAGISFYFRHPTSSRERVYVVSLFTRRNKLKAKIMPISNLNIQNARNFKAADKDFHKLALRIIRDAVRSYNTRPEPSVREFKG